MSTSIQQIYQPYSSLHKNPTPAVSKMSVHEHEQRGALILEHKECHMETKYANKKTEAIIVRHIINNVSV